MKILRLLLTLIVLSSLSLSQVKKGGVVTAYSPPQSPNTVPAAGCSAGHTQAGIGFCPHQFYNLPNMIGVMLGINASMVDTGSTAPAFTAFNSAFDNKNQMYAPGYAVTSISNTAGTTTANVNGGPWDVGITIWIYGNTGGSAVYNGAWTLTAATYSGNNIVSVAWSQGGSPATCSSNCGFIEEACGGGIPGHTAAPCRIAIAITKGSSGVNVGIPSYVFTQAWANTACLQSPWAANTLFAIDFCIWVPSVGHYYHASTVCTGGMCLTGGTQPVSWNVSGGTTTDGTVVWQDDGTTNALPQKSVVNGTAGNFSGGPNAPPAGGVYNINSTTCGVGGTTQCVVADVASGLQLIWMWPYLYWEQLYDACYDGDTWSALTGCSLPHSGNPGAIVHYAAASWTSQIDYLIIGTSTYTETFIWAESFITANYGMTNAQLLSIWTQGAAATYTANWNTWNTLALPWPLIGTTNVYPSCGANCQTLPNLLAAAITSHSNYGLGSEGLQVSDLTSWAAGNNPATSNGWVLVAQTYYSQVPIIEIESLFDSNPSTQVGCTSGEINTGSLQSIFPFATQHHATYFQIYTFDMLAAFDPNYVPSGACATYATAQIDHYQQVIWNANNGIPNATSGITGNVKISGNASNQ